jgi:hypothetical protein
MRFSDPTTQKKNYRRAAESAEIILNNLADKLSLCDDTGNGMAAGVAQANSPFGQSQFVS